MNVSLLAANVVVLGLVRKLIPKPCWMPLKGINIPPLSCDLGRIISASPLGTCLPIAAIPSDQAEERNRDRPA